MFDDWSVDTRGGLRLLDRAEEVERRADRRGRMAARGDHCEDWWVLTRVEAIYVLFRSASSDFVVEA